MAIAPSVRRRVDAERAAAWLLHAWKNRDSEVSPGIVIDVLALSTVCKLLCGSPIAAEITTSVARTMPEPSWWSSNTTSSLIAAVGAFQEKNALSDSAENYLAALIELEPEMQDGPNRVLVKMALHGASFPAKNRISLSADTLLRGNDRVQEFVAEVERLSQFGTITVEADEPSGLLLEGAALAAFRRYDLPLAMRLLRVRRYIGDVDSFGLGAGIRCLQSTRCDDGSYGDYEGALAHMSARGHSNGLLLLKVPVTLQALWTLAELEDPEFSLMRSAIGRDDASEILEKVRQAL